MTDSHPTDTAIAAFVDGDQASGALADHIASCPRCGSIAARLGEDSFDDISDWPLQEHAPLVPPVTVQAVASAQIADLATDQIWRAVSAVEGINQLVWIRRLRSDGRAAAVPVSFDAEYADEYSLIVPAEGSPLGIDTVFHTTAETTIDPRFLIDCIVDPAGVATDIATIRHARAHGSPVQDLPVGSPILSLVDNRIEYRQQLSDALVGLTTARLDPDQSNEDGNHDLPVDISNDSAIRGLIGDEISAELIGQLLDGLAHTYPAARVVPTQPSMGLVSNVSAFATIVNIDVLVSIVTLTLDIPDADLPEMSRSVFDADMSVHAVCFVSIEGSFDTRLIDRRALSDAYETPSGVLRVPEDVPHGPVVDVLGKFFDRRVNPFRAITTATIDPITISQRDLAVQHGSAAVRDIAKRAARLHVPGKADGYRRVTGHRDAVIRIVEQALTRDAVDIAAILEDEQ